MQQFETAQSLPAAIRARVPGELVCYGRSVVHQEWPRMEDGTAGDAINPWGVAALPEPPAGGAQGRHRSSRRTTSGSTRPPNARRPDATGSTARPGIIPTSIWLVLFLMAAVVFAYMLFFADSAERALSQAMLIGSATTVLVATLLAIHALDNPYRPGVGSIRPVAMERSLRMLDEARAVLGDTTPAPVRRAGSAT